MDIIRLGLPYTTNYKADELVEGLKSAIWTERFAGNSEFEFHTYDIDNTMALLPEDTLISHTDTNEVMMVEDHLITYDESLRKYDLKITGRSLAMFPMDHRFVEGPYQKKRQMVKNYTPVGALAVLLYNVVDNDSGFDVTRKDLKKVYNGDPDNGAASVALVETTYPWNTKDKIPNVSVTDSVVAAGDNQDWWVTEGQLGPQFLDILNKNNLGLRIIRPNGTSGKIVTVGDTGYADIGDITRTQTDNIGSLRFDIYDGLDRSISQSDNPQVVFSVGRGDVDKPQYLFSVKEFKTAIEVMSDPSGDDVYRTDTQKAWTGLQRRVGSFDGGKPDIPDEPERPDPPGANATSAEKKKYDRQLERWKQNHDDWKLDKADILAKFALDNQNKGARMLHKQRKVYQFSGGANSETPYNYKEHYNLGDRVTIQGDYGLVQDMIVAEHVRTQDATGESEYPGLTLP